MFSLLCKVEQTIDMQEEAHEKIAAITTLNGETTTFTPNDNERFFQEDAHFTDEQEDIRFCQERVHESEKGKQFKWGTPGLNKLRTTTHSIERFSHAGRFHTLPLREDTPELKRKELPEKNEKQKCRK